MNRPPKSDESCIADARLVAAQRGMYIVARGTSEWLVYRASTIKGERGHFLGRRSSPAQLLRLVQQLGSTTA